MIPHEATSEDVQTLFQQYGTIRKCTIITGPDGRSKGCAMVLFERWTAAEAAVERENGTSNLGGPKPMVVKFADPPRRGDGPVVGITPKKLFVGQVGQQQQPSTAALSMMWVCCLCQTDTLNDDRGGATDTVQPLWRDHWHVPS